MQKKNFVVLGAGLSGLSAAHYLLRAAPNSNVLVKEATGRVGGWVRSQKHESGLLFEHGPRTVRVRHPHGSITLGLLDDLGLSAKIKGITGSHPAARNRMIYVNHNLHPLPNSLMSMLVKKPPFSSPLAAAVLHDLRAKPQKVEDESIYNFVERRFGKELADYGISPMICGICAGDAKEISVKFLMENLFKFEQKHGSVFKGFVNEFLLTMFSRNTMEPKGNLAREAMLKKWVVWFLEGGLEELPISLLKRVQESGGKVELNSPCSKIKFENSGTLLKIQDSDIQADHVISTIPAKRLASLIADEHPELSKELSAIPSVTVGVVNLAFRGKVLKHDAFGFLIPPLENKPILGVLFDTCCNPQGENTVLTVMMGGRWFDKHFGSQVSKETLLETAKSQVKSILDIKQDPFAHEVSILKDCIPQYVVGHSERIRRIREYIELKNLPLSLAGSSYDGVGINDVIFSSKTAVTKLL